MRRDREARLRPLAAHRDSAARRLPGRHGIGLARRSLRPWALPGVRGTTDLRPVRGRHLGGRREARPPRAGSAAGGVPCGARDRRGARSRARYTVANAPCRSHGAVGARTCPGLVPGGASALRERPDDAGGGHRPAHAAATVRSRRWCGIARDKVDRRLGSFEGLSFIVADADAAVATGDAACHAVTAGRTVGPVIRRAPQRGAPTRPLFPVACSRLGCGNCRTSARCRSRGPGGASSLPATRPSSSSSRAPARP